MNCRRPAALLRALHAHTKGIIDPRDLGAIRSWIHVLEPLTGYQRHKTIKAVGGVYLGYFSTVKLYGGQKV